MHRTVHKYCVTARMLSKLDNLEMGSSRLQLLIAAQSFCDTFAQKEDIDTILSHFSKTREVSAIEYGEPSLASFLGRPFLGATQIKEYFLIINSLLSYERLTFSEFLVDTETSRVALKGKGEFTWLGTQKSWEEVFTYTLDFDDELKVVRYQVWADTGSAYLARVGQLDQVREVSLLQ